MAIMLLGAWSIYMFQQSPEDVSLWHKDASFNSISDGFTINIFLSIAEWYNSTAFSRRKISDANGLIEMMQFMATIFGTAASAIALKHPAFLLIFPITAIIGYLFSLKIPKVESQNESLKLNWSVFGDLFRFI